MGDSRYLKPCRIFLVLLTIFIATVFMQLTTNNFAMAGNKQDIIIGTSGISESSSIFFGQTTNTNHKLQFQVEHLSKIKLYVH